VDFIDRSASTYYSRDMVDMHDAKFKALYLSTARDYIKSLSRDFQSLLQEPNNPNYISQIRINAHSVKGQSNAMGYTHIATVSHMIEEVARRCIEDQKAITQSEIYAMQSSLSSLSSALDTVEREDHEVDLTQIENELKGALSLT
jgi:chemotaxis protein histidine kinase CheA